MDATAVGDKLVFQCFGAFADFECVIIRERTLSSLTPARTRG